MAYIYKTILRYCPINKTNTDEKCNMITKHYALGMSGMAIAKSLNASPSGVNDFLRAFKECRSLGYAYLPE